MAKQITVTWTDVEKIGARWVPRKVTVRDLVKESSSQLLVEKIDLDVDLPDREFSQSELAKGH
jgi:hypothetical protein